VEAGLQVFLDRELGNPQVLGDVLAVQTLDRRSIQQVRSDEMRLGPNVILVSS
jgi:hypothetical protein